EPGRPIPMNADQRKAHRQECQDAADGEVDAAADNHQSHAARQNAEDGGLAQSVTMSAEFEESALSVENATEQQNEEKSDQSTRGLNPPRSRSLICSVLMFVLYHGTSHRASLSL